MGNIISFIESEGFISLACANCASLKFNEDHECMECGKTVLDKGDLIPQSKGMKTFTLTYEQLNLTREWFNRLKYAMPDPLQDEDHFLAEDIHEMLGVHFKHAVKIDKDKANEK